MSGPEFMAFNSIEDAYDFMRRGDEFGNRNLHPAQQAITWGDYWVRFYDVANRLIIFGYGYTYDEFVAAESEGMDAITDPEERMEREEELRYSIASVRDSHERGYMFGWAWSKGERDLGSTHRFNMWPISKELFEAAKAVDWDVDRLPRGGELERAYQAYRRHVMNVAASGDQP